MVYCHIGCHAVKLRLLCLFLVSGSWFGVLLSTRNQVSLVNQLVSESVVEFDIEQKVDETVDECCLACSSLSAHHQIDYFVTSSVARASSSIQGPQLSVSNFIFDYPHFLNILRCEIVFLFGKRK